jgi:hypothetical protein
MSEEVISFNASSPHEYVAKEYKRTRNLFFAVLVLAIFLRLALVIINRDANDTHWDVAMVIIEAGSLPTKSDCWECFQPKLYHVVFAKFIQVLGLSHLHPGKLNVIGQTLSFVAGISTLALVGSFVRRMRLDTWKQLILFSLVALNPPLTAIHAQATNDSFAIFFSTLGLYFTYDFLRKPNTKAFLIILTSVSLGISSKANVWVTAIAIFISLEIMAWAGREHRRKSAQLVIVFSASITIIAVLNPLNQYISNLQEYRSPIVNNISAQPLPHMFTRTTYARPGILSVTDGFLTFRFGELIQHPRVEFDEEKIPLFQTSFWSLLYGRTHSIHFDNWPSTWSTTDSSLFPLTRAILLFAIPPTFLLLLGAWIELRLLIKGFNTRDGGLVVKAEFGLSTFVFFGYILFLIFYALIYRDHSVIKAIFIFPGLLAYLVLFSRGVESILALSGRRQRMATIIIMILSTGLIALYIADIAALIVRLA